MQRYNQRMIEQLRIRQQQEKGRLPKIQRSEGKTRMAMYKKSLHINSSGSMSEQREKIKQVRLTEPSGNAAEHMVLWKLPPWPRGGALHCFAGDIAVLEGNASHLSTVAHPGKLRGSIDMPCGRKAVV